MIYFLRAGDHVKIGRTRDDRTLKLRIAMLQTGQAHPLSVLRTIAAPDWAEIWLHGFFAGARISGEWFTYSPTMLSIEIPAERPSKQPPRFGNTRYSRTGARRNVNRRSYQVAIRLPLALSRHLDRLAFESGRPRAEIVIEALCKVWDLRLPARLEKRALEPNKQPGKAA